MAKKKTDTPQDKNPDLEALEQRIEKLEADVKSLRGV